MSAPAGIAGALLALEPDARHREHKRALRAAYAHARRGNDAGADLWVAVAGALGEVDDAARGRVEKLLRSCATRPLPGQLEIADALEA